MTEPLTPIASGAPPGEVSATPFAGFGLEDIETPRGPVRVRVGGSGPPLLLLHGYPQTPLAADLVDAMRQLGHAAFAAGGHHRGGRVACRMALDHPDRVHRLVVLDVVPTGEVWARADARLELAYWHGRSFVRTTEQEAKHVN